ncbi:MAG: T9SS type A sorting domain-containing protein [Taibaiella sp.]|nr:T9SS type A sorting domain-containing protein [Taibaiella sp.]
MKKRILLCTALLGISYLTLSSYRLGAAFEGGQNCTGAKASITNCGGGGCHGGASTATSVTITVDSAGIPITQYSKGHLYTIKIHGTNTSNLPGFGLEFTAVTGTGTSQTSAGTFSTPGAGLRKTVATFGLTLIEQSNGAILSAIAGIYDTSFQWTAPTTNAGNVIMYCTLNAVNGNGTNDFADVSSNTSITLAQSTTGIAAFANDVVFNTYPNPAGENVHVQISNAPQGAYQLAVYDLNGRSIETVSTTNTGAGIQATISTSSWPAGMYMLQVSGSGAKRTMQIVKN